MAQNLQVTLQGRLVPLARFCLFENDGVRIAKGIAPKGPEDGAWDASVAAFNNGKKRSMLWADPEKRPWRSLPAILGFLSSTTPNGYYRCVQLELGCRRLNLAQINQFGIWSGGLKVSKTMSEQQVKGGDDMVESEVTLDRQVMEREGWFDRFAQQMKWLEDQAKMLYACVCSYFATLGSKDEGARHAQKATGLYWDLAERHFQELLDACAAKTEPEKIEVFHKAISRIIHTCYDNVCGRESARQLQAWAKHRPRISWNEDAKHHAKGNRRKAGAKLRAKQLAAVTREDAALVPGPVTEARQEAAPPTPLPERAETKHDVSSPPLSGITAQAETKAKKARGKQGKATGQLSFLD